VARATVARSDTRRAHFWVQIGVAFAALMFIGTNDGAVGVLLPSLQEHYILDKRTVSFLFFAGTCGYLMAAFSSGLLVEWLGRRLFLMLGGAALSVGMLTIATVPSWIVVLLALVALGFGVAIVDAGLNAYVASLPNNTALLNYLHAFYGGGALVGPILASSILAAGWNWSRVYGVLATLAILLAIGLTVAFRSDGKAAQRQAAAESGASGNVMTAALSLPIVWVAALFLFLYVGVEVSVGSWIYSLLTEQRRMDALIAAWLVSGYWFGLMLGRLVLGSVTERLGHFLVIQLCLGGTVIGLLLLWLVPVTPAAALGLALAGFSLGPIFPTLIAVISQLVAQRLLASAIGFMTSLGAGGAAFFPWLAGNLANEFGIWTILPYAIGLTLGVLALWLLFQFYAAKTERDARRRAELPEPSA
jgi:fucose permease